MIIEQIDYYMIVIVPEDEIFFLTFHQRFLELDIFWQFYGWKD